MASTCPCSIVAIAKRAWVPPMSAVTSFFMRSPGAYPERIKYARDEHVEPIAVHCVSGARLPDGAVMLERRVIGLDDAPGNLVIKIEVDTEERYFDKAKYDDAEDAGVRHDRWGDTFYVDAVEPGET
jgi:hypothetical protein